MQGVCPTDGWRVFSSICGKTPPVLRTPSPNAGHLGRDWGGVVPGLIFEIQKGKVFMWFSENPPLMEHPQSRRLTEKNGRRRTHNIGSIFKKRKSSVKRLNNPQIIIKLEYLFAMFG
jgi:hypothetical protein